MNGIVFVATDVSEHKTVTEQLHASEDQLRQSEARLQEVDEELRRARSAI